jgi:hypothetical protein
MASATFVCHSHYVFPIEKVVMETHESISGKGGSRVEENSKGILPSFL